MKKCDLVKIPVLVGDEIVGVCQFGPLTSESAIRDIESGDLDSACRCICGVASYRDGRFTSLGQAKEVLEVGKSILRCTWCDHEIEETGLVLRHNDDPFCNQVCLDLQREDDALFAEVEEVLGDEKLSYRV